MNVYAFDVDETLEITGGPVKFSQVINLRNQGHIVGICGNYAIVTRFAQNWHLVFSFIGQMDMTKEAFLRQIKMYVPANRYLMVGNEFPKANIIGDKIQSEAAGWEFVEAKDFKEGL